MCTLENGKAKFDRSEYWKMFIGMFGAAMAACAIVAGIAVTYIDLRLEAHTGKSEIHQDTQTKTDLYMPRTEFETWKDAHLQRPHSGVPDAINDLRIELKTHEH